MSLNDSSLEILINVPLKHPEVNAVKFTADKKTIALQFALKGLPGGADLNEFNENIRKAGKIYHGIMGNSVIIMELAVNEIEGVTFISLFRDEESISEEEIDIYIALLKEKYDHYLIKDRINIEKQDSYKRRLKNSLKHKLHEAHNCSYFWAFRQGGKVFVLNR